MDFLKYYEAYLELMFEVERSVLSLKVGRYYAEKDGKVTPKYESDAVEFLEKGLVRSQTVLGEVYEPKDFKLFIPSWEKHSETK